MEENWDNIPGVAVINRECEQSDKNTTGGYTNENGWNSTKNNSPKYKTSENYTDWDPTNNNGHTDDDKLIEDFSEKLTTTTNSFDGTNTDYDDWNNSKFDDNNQTNASFSYEKKEQINLDNTNSKSLNDSWGNPISSDQYSTDTGNSEFNGYTKQNSHNDYVPEDSWDIEANTNNSYQKYQNNGYNESGRDYQQNTRFPKKSNNYTNTRNDKGNSKSVKPIAQKSTYIPPEFEENDDLTLEAGLNFEKYDKIEVTVSGTEVPKNITSFHDSGLNQILLNNLTKCHYTTPTPIQKYAIPIIMNGKDMIASAQTGSGKTVSKKSYLNAFIIILYKIVIYFDFQAAFVLPILNNLISEPSELVVDYNHCEPQALILSPTRELAIQICEVTTRLSKNTSIKCELLYGGTATYHQKERILVKRIVILLINII